MFVLLFLLVWTGACSLPAGHITGQPREVSVKNRKVWRAARFAVSDFNQAYADERFLYKLIHVTSAKVQVVAGINYILEVQLRRVCKDSPSDHQCRAKNDPKELRCVFVVTEIPWQDKRFVYRRRCKPQQT